MALNGSSLLVLCVKKRGKEWRKGGREGRRNEGREIGKRRRKGKEEGKREGGRERRKTPGWATCTTLCTKCPFWLKCCFLLFPPVLDVGL